MTRSPEMGPSSNPEGIAERILKKASKFGFDSAGWTKASPPLDFVFFSQWLSNGMHGEMNYLDKHRDARSDPNSILPGVKTILMVSMNYKPEPRLPRNALGETRQIWPRVGRNAARTILEGHHGFGPTT